MGVRDRNTGELSMTEEEKEAVSKLKLLLQLSSAANQLGFYHAFCFYKV